MMKLITIVASAALVSAGTNKTLAPTPGISRPGTPAPITPFPTEPPQVCLILLLLLCVLLYCNNRAAAGSAAAAVHHIIMMRWCMMYIVATATIVYNGTCIYQHNRSIDQPTTSYMMGICGWSTAGIYDRSVRHRYIIGRWQLYCNKKNTLCHQYCNEY